MSLRSSLVVVGSLAFSLALGCTTPMLVPYDGGRDGGANDASVNDAFAPIDGGSDAGPTCATGTVDLNHDPSDGCEYTCTMTSANDEPDSTFADANCDGIDGEVASGIFVSLAGNDSNPGTMPMPVLTIAHAITLAAASGGQVYVDHGTYTETLVLVDGVGVYGGFDRTVSRAGSIPGYWDRRADATTTIEGGTTAIEATAITRGAVLDRLTIHAASATAAGTPSIGVWAHGSTGTLRISASIIVAGAGAAGTAGTMGTNGAAGGPGAVGTAGTSMCGHAGGTGGSGGSPTGNGAMGAMASMGGSGGAGGTASPGCVTAGSPPVGGPGGPGGPGTAGVDGADTAGGDGLGSFTLAGAWTPSDGTIGGDGTDGTGGGGGGGGGGGTWRPTPIFTCMSGPGGTGGGGGGGGCHGAPGREGTGGGASFGVLSVDAVVVVLNDDITSGTGGNGGAGGSGGAAGAGGAGGPGMPSGSYGGTGGAGGAGRAGGRGGHGGGGGGGPSICLAHAGSGSLTNTGSILHAGTGGTGGASMGMAGSTGTSAQVQEY